MFYIAVLIHFGLGIGLDLAWLVFEKGNAASFLSMPIGYKGNQ